MRKSIIYLGILAVLLTGVTLFLMLMRDKTGPEIKVEGTLKEYSKEMEKSELLSDVTAFDEIDGDVSSNLMIYDIVESESKGIATIVYVAMDNSNNLTTYKRKVSMKKAKSETSLNREKTIPKEEVPVNNPSARQEVEENEPAITYPRIILTTNEVTKKVGENFYFGDYVSEVEDDTDEASTLYRRIRVEGDYNMAQAGEYELLFYVIDSEGNYSERENLTLKVEAR